MICGTLGPPRLASNRTSGTSTRSCRGRVPSTKTRDQNRFVTVPVFHRLLGPQPIRRCLDHLALLHSWATPQEWAECQNHLQLPVVLSYSAVPQQVERHNNRPGMASRSIDRIFPLCKTSELPMIPKDLWKKSWKSSCSCSLMPLLTFYSSAKYALGGGPLTLFFGGRTCTSMDCWWTKSCITWYGLYISCISQLVQGFLHQQWHPEEQLWFPLNWIVYAVCI